MKNSSIEFWIDTFTRDIRVLFLFKVWQSAARPGCVYRTFLLSPCRRDRALRARCTNGVTLLLDPNDVGLGPKGGRG